MAPLNDFVCRHFKNEERTERLNELEAEAAKLDDGTYVHTLRRDVFLAYSSADMAKVLEIVDVLEENGLTVFAAFRNLRHGKGAAENYLNALKEAMRACACFIFLSSDSSRQMTCDAMSVELPFLTGELPEKPRIEYMLSDYPDRMPFMVKSTLKLAFPEQEHCRDLESLVTRVYAIRTSKPSSSKVDEEALRKKIEEETRKKIEEENARRLEEERRKKAEEEAARKAQEEADGKARKDTVFCPKCGSDNAPGNAFCMRCGFKLETAGEKTDQPPTASNNAICNPADYEIKEGVLVKYRGFDKDIAIPNGVASIGEKAFDYCSSLKSVIIPRGVISIGDYAFRNCKALETIVIPEGVVSIGVLAFECCALTSVHLPASLVSLGDNPGYVFSSCNALKEIKVDPNNKKFDSRNDCNAIIETETNTLVAGCPATLIPEGIRAIGPSAFHGRHPLARADLPSSLTSIGEYAFTYCDSLTSLLIPRGVTFISEGAFASTSALTQIEVEHGNERYDSRGGCNAIIETKTSKLIAGCKETVIPENVVSIGYHAFYGCQSLESLTIPPRVVSIGVAAFENCFGLKSLTLSEGLQEISWAAFDGCIALDEVHLPSSLTKIAGRAFASCRSLKTLIIPPSVTSIGPSAFDGCSCTLKISGAKKGIFGKASYPKDFDKDFLKGFKGTVMN